jgi:hypothetical protein
MTKRAKGEKAKKQTEVEQKKERTKETISPMSFTPGTPTGRPPH